MPTKRTVRLPCGCLLVMLLLAAWVKSKGLRAQEASGKEQSLCQPGLKGMAPGKGLAVGLSDAPLSFLHHRNGQTAGLRSQQHAYAKLRFPILLKDRFQLIGGLGYRQHGFAFRAPQDEALGYVRKPIEAQRFRQTNFKLYGALPLDARRYVKFRLKTGFSGQYAGLLASDSRFLRHSAAVLYGWKSGEDREMGFGLYASLNHDRQTVLPAFLWNRNFKGGWGLDMLLPARAHLRYNVSPVSIVKSGIRFQQDVYALKPGPRDAFREFRHRYLDLEIEWEKRLARMVWLSLRGGYHYSLGSEAAISENHVFVGRISDAWFLAGEFSLRLPMDR